jgi:hypothetical protein
LHIDGGAQSLASGREDDKRLVAAKLDQLSAVICDNATDDGREGGGKRGRSLVALLLSEARVTTDVRDQERADDRDGRARAGATPIYGLVAAAVDRFSLNL